MLREQLPVGAAGLAGPIQVRRRNDVVVLVGERGGIEDDPVASLQQPVAEVEVLPAEQPFAGEADVEAARRFVGAARNRHLAGQEVGDPDFGARGGEALPS